MKWRGEETVSVFVYFHGLVFDGNPVIRGRWKRVKSEEIITHYTCETVLEIMMKVCSIECLIYYAKFLFLNSKWTEILGWKYIIALWRCRLQSFYVAFLLLSRKVFRRVFPCSMRQPALGPSASDMQNARRGELKTWFFRQSSTVSHHRKHTPPRSSRRHQDVRVWGQRHLEGGQQAQWVMAPLPQINETGGGTLLSTRR